MKTQAGKETAVNQTSAGGTSPAAQTPTSTSAANALPAILQTVGNPPAAQPDQAISPASLTGLSELGRMGTGAAPEGAQAPVGSGSSTTPLPGSTLPGSSSPQVPAQSLAVHIASQARAGNQRFDIRLDPPELGRVDIRLEIGRDGQTLTHLAVEKPETLDLLRQDSRQLERALANAGLDSREGGLSFSLREDPKRGQQAQAEQQDQGVFDKGESEDADASVIKQTVEATSGLDISI